MTGHPLWPGIDELFEQASALNPQAQSQFLRDRCVDPALRAEVAELLIYGAGAQVVFQSIIAAATEDLQRSHREALTGKRIGAYVLVRELGRGGLGAVYLAVRSDDQFQQLVAIKVVHRAMESEFLLNQFRQERQVLANLSHPNISRLLDGGATAEGLPFFAMEYLDGPPIVEYCSNLGLNLRQRINLFFPVCDALQYAHRHLVIHRDVKPGNVLVTEDGIPKLLDFGIAKLVDEHCSRHPGDAAVTLHYASPEQLRGEVVTTSADIYSLGALLRKVLNETGFALPKDVQSILDKSMRESVADRYASALDLANDLRRFLAGHPVQARIPTVSYRLARFISRNRMSAIVAGLLSLAAIVALAMYLYQVQLARRRFQDLHHLASSFVFELDEKIQALPGSTQARAEVAAKALAYLNRLAAEKGKDAELQREVANAYLKVADVQGDPLASNLGDSAGARSSYQQAIALLTTLHGRRARRDLVLVYKKFAWFEFVSGSPARAQEIVATALPLAKALAKQTDPESEQLLAEMEIIDCRILTSFGQITAAEQQVQAALLIYRTLGVSDLRYRDSIADAYSALGAIQIRSGLLPEALESYRSTLNMRRQAATENPRNVTVLRNLMLAHSHIADTLLAEGPKPGTPEAAAALVSFQEVLSIAGKLTALDPSDQKARIDRSIAMMRLGNALGTAGKPAKAIVQLQEALAITDELSGTDRNNRRLQINSAYILDRLGSQLESTGQRVSALGMYKRSIATLHALVASDPEGLDVQIQLLRTLVDYGSCLAKSGSAAEALKQIDGISSLGEHIAESGSAERFLSQRPRAWAGIGAIEETLGDRKAARNWYRRSSDAWTVMQTGKHLSASLTAEAIRTNVRLRQLTRH